MTAHRLHIGQMRTTCQFKAEHTRREVMRQAVDHACRSRLPAALEQALEQVLRDQTGVIRVRSLQVALTSLQPMGSDLVNLLAGRIAALVRGLLSGGQDGVCVWPSHTAYLAHFVLWKLGLRQGADWAFDDFAALDHVSPQQAAVAILSARPQVFWAIVRDPALHGAAGVLSRALEPSQIVALFAGIAQQSQDITIPDLAAFWQADAAQRIVGIARPEIADAALTALELLMRLAAGGPDEPAPQLAMTAARLAMITAALAALPPVLLRQSRTGWPIRLRVTAARALPAPLLDVLTRTARTKAGQALLDQIAARVLAEAAHTVPQPATDAQAEPATAQLSALCAGSALLLPSLIQLDSDQALSAAHRHAVALQVLPADLRRRATRDPGYLRLFPCDPQAPLPTDWPTLPNGEPGDVVGWGQAILRHFADRLPGLSQSSAGYLQDQFLAQSGDVIVTPDDITVLLHRVPLGIVLSMGGHLGLRGRVPWLEDRQLSIHLKSGDTP